MRIASILVLGIAALTSPTDALRSASSTLARLSQRLVAAEPLSYPPPFAQYTFDRSDYADKMQSTRKGRVTPPTANNIKFAADNIRGGTVVERAISKSNAASVLTFPNQLTQSFTVGMWINWNGVATGEQNYVFGSSDGLFQFYMSHLGDVNYYVAVVNGVRITDTTEVPELAWRFYAIVVDHETQQFHLYSGDLEHAIHQIGTGVRTTYPGTAPSLVFGNYGPLPVANKGWYGYIDDISIYDTALPQPMVTALWRGTNTAAAVTPAPGYGYYGHFAESKVMFGNRNAGKPVGDWSIVFELSDTDAPVGSEIRVLMHGCGGTDATKTFSDGTTLTWSVENGIVSIKPAHTIPKGTLAHYPIKSSEITVVNPTNLPAEESDSQWKIGIILHPKGALRYEGIKHTPATINLNAALLEMN